MISVIMWKIINFKNFIELQRGFDLFKSQFIDGNHPVIGASNIVGFHNEYKVKGPGVITGRTGTIGTIQYMEIDFWPHQDTLWVKDFKGNDKKFVYYFLKTLKLDGFNAGGAVPALNRNHLNNLKINIPDFETQQKIATILSTYDDLIENNKARIALLEDMAAEVYKEWFVRLRFPGSEKVEVVDGLPMGWEKGTLGDIAVFKKGRNITLDTITVGNVPVVAGGLSPAYYHNEANTKSPTITISASGANAGFINMYFEDIWASDCSYLDVKSTKSIYFFYLLLKNKQKEVYYLQKGSAQPHVYPKDVMSIKMAKPTFSLIEKFEQLITPMFEEIKILQEKNDILQSTRDLLLPRLISGKLEV